MKFIFAIPYFSHQNFMNFLFALPDIFDKPSSNWSAFILPLFGFITLWYGLQCGWSNKNCIVSCNCQKRSGPKCEPKQSNIPEFPLVPLRGLNIHSSVPWFVYFTEVKTPDSFSLKFAKKYFYF